MSDDDQKKPEKPDDDEVKELERRGVKNAEVLFDILGTSDSDRRQVHKIAGSLDKWKIIGRWMDVVGDEIAVQEEEDGVIEAASLGIAMSVVMVLMIRAARERQQDMSLDEIRVAMRTIIDQTLDEIRTQDDAEDSAELEDE